jgi:hypothetical protein
MHTDTEPQHFTHVPAATKPLFMFRFGEVQMHRKAASVDLLKLICVVYICIRNMYMRVNVLLYLHINHVKQ